MSNFAERLIARGAGRAPGPGLALLTLRPSSRFEPSTYAGIEVSLGVMGGAEDDRRPMVTHAPRIGPATGPPSIPSHDMPGAIAEIASPEGTGVAVRKARYAPDSVSPPTAGRPIRAPPAQSPERPISRALSDETGSEGIAEQELSTRSSPHGDGVATIEARDTERPNASMLRSRDEQLQADRELPQRSAKAAEAAVAASEPGRSSSAPSWGVPREGTEAPPPVISIGRIEVQFLPQEPRNPAPRPEPQRTRGFEAYARARRGEPR